MTARPAGLAAVASAVTLVLACAATPPVGAAPARPARSVDVGRIGGQEAPLAPGLRLTSQPLSVAPDDAFPVFLRVEAPPAGGDLVVDIYDRLTDPAELDREPTASAGTFDAIPLGDTDGIDETTQGFAIELYRPGEDRPDGPWAFPLDEPGVYPVRVKLRDADGEVLDTLVTHLIRRPAADEEVPTARLALLATLHDDPGPTPDTPLSSRFRTRLSRFLGTLRTHPDLPVTFAATPETVERMADDPGSAEVLDELRTELGRDGRGVLDAPYVDIDPASLVDAGLEDELGRQRDLGRRVLDDVLEEPATGTWLVDDPIDEPTLEALRAKGIFRVLLPATSVQGPPPSSTVSLPAGDGEVRALVMDDRASVASSDADELADPLLHAHELLARLATTAEQAGDGATVVLSLDATTNASLALPTFFDGLTFGAPFLATRSIGSLLDDVGSPEPQLVSPDLPNLGRYGSVATEVHADLASYESMVATRPELVTRYAEPLALAASDDLSLRTRLDALETIGRGLQRRFRAVTTPARDKVTLGARNAEFPLVVTSSLGYPVDVKIEVEANERLRFPEEAIERRIVEGRNEVRIRVRTKASGDTPVRITVRSADGRVVLAESQYTIRSTAVSGVGLVLTIGAAVFLALWWGRNWRRTRHLPRHARGKRPKDGPAGEADPDPSDEM